MHVLLIILIALLAVIVVLLGILAFVVLSAYFAVQPIINQLGKISLIVEVIQFICRRYKARIRRRNHHSEEEWE